MHNIFLGAPLLFCEESLLQRTNVSKFLSLNKIFDCRGQWPVGQRISIFMGGTCSGPWESKEAPRNNRQNLTETT
jgi:hypothetical protein